MFAKQGIHLRAFHGELQAQRGVASLLGSLPVVNATWAHVPIHGAVDLYGEEASRLFFAPAARCRSQDLYLASRIANQHASQEDQSTAQAYLQGRRERRRIHVPVADPRDDT